MCVCSNALAHALLLSLLRALLLVAVTLTRIKYAQLSLCGAGCGALGRSNFDPKHSNHTHTYIHTDEQNIGDDAAVDADADVQRWYGGSFVLFCAVCASLIVGVAGCVAGSPLRHMCSYNYSKYTYIHIICTYMYYVCMFACM